MARRQAGPLGGEERVEELFDTIKRQTKDDGKHIQGDIVAKVSLTTERERERPAPSFP